MKRLLIYLSCFLVVGGGGTLLQGCDAWELPAERTVSIGEGLVAYLPFNKGSLQDSLRTTDTRRANNALWGNAKTKPHFVPGFSEAQDNSDLAVNLDGTTDFILLPDHPTIQFKTAFSVSLWIKPALKPINRVMQIYHKAKFDSSNGRSSNESYSMAINPVKIVISNNFSPRALMILSNVKMDGAKKASDQYSCESAGPGWQSTNFPVDTTVLEDNQWHHIVYTYADSAVSVYFDGSRLSGNGRLDGTQIKACSGGELRFGMETPRLNSNDNFTKFFKGAMDEIRLYNRELKPNEVMSLFTLKKARNK